MSKGIISDKWSMRVLGIVTGSAIESITMSRGRISDKWSMRVLWGCAIGSAIGLYMVAVERQTQNRAKALAEGSGAADSQGDGDTV